jgi:hypothetical protein
MMQTEQLPGVLVLFERLKLQRYLADLQQRMGSSAARQLIITTIALDFLDPAASLDQNPLPDQPCTHAAY